MLDVPILIFEDAPLQDSVELRRLVNFPRTEITGEQEYRFNWHPIYNALGGISHGTPVLIRSLQVYREAARYLRDELSGEAIIFMDLHFTEPTSQEGGGKFNLTTDDVPDGLLEFASCVDDKVKSKEDVLQHFNPFRLGFMLAAIAARNTNWRGMIFFASQRVNVELGKVERCLNTGDRILWRDLRQAMAVGSTAQARAKIIGDAIEEFLERRKGPPFWPDQTNDWFKTLDSEIPHDPPPDSNQAVVDKVRGYLIQLLGGFAPPEPWFKSPQWECLYETLKGLIGAHSVSAAGTSKNLRLPAVPLILAAQMASKGSDIRWFKSFVWQSGRAEIMAHQNTADARESIRAMAVFLEHLSVGSNGESQVIGAMWGTVPGDRKKHLLIDFNIDPLSRVNGRGLLPTIFGSRWGDDKGQTVGAYEAMMECARKPGSAPSFSLCIYPVTGGDGQTITRLDFRTLEG